jgi:prefoldin alpha subunit
MKQEIDPELMIKFQMFEKQIQQLQEQIQAVEQGTVELQMLELGLDDLKGKTGQDILAPMGKGIFVKAKLISEELLVDIGDKKFVTKNIDDTKKLIGNQVKKLEDIKKELEDAMEGLGEEIDKSMREHSGEHPCKCHPGEKCECEDDDCEGNGKECKCGKAK